MLFCLFARKTGDISLSRRGKIRKNVDLSRRKFLRELAEGASFAFLPSGLSYFPFSTSSVRIEDGPSSHQFHLHPAYRNPRELDAVLRKVKPGFDAFVTEKYHDEVAAVLSGWRAELLRSPTGLNAIGKSLSDTFLGVSFKPVQSRPVRPDSFLKLERLIFADEAQLEANKFLDDFRSTLALFSLLVVVEFQVTSIRADPASAASLRSLQTQIRFELVGTGKEFHREQRVGNWSIDWERAAPGDWRVTKWIPLEETRSRSLFPIFVDVASQAFATSPSFSRQLLPGVDHWRSVLDGACGIDIYGHNGVAVGDIDGDGFDDLYICQPAGLPNRLYRNRGDGTFEDITEASGGGILENTACALFADIRNIGRQDLIIVRANGPLLLLNDGKGRFQEKPEAFRFANPPQGTFTGAAIADYDRDGWLDIYFCLYVYYQGADQYRYPCPYFDAENGPPNFLMRNQRDGTFRDVTKEAKLDTNNSRFSFCCAWNNADPRRGPDLYVVNDFGRKNFYRNNGDGTFTDIAEDAGVLDIGAGMSVSWLDYNNDEKPDLYVANMWTAAGTRITEQDIFQNSASQQARAMYRKHAMGNSLYRNLGADSRFQDQTAASGAGIGRWAWSSDAWDLDHDGFPDLYIANGMITGTSSDDLNSFFWRQVVANSPSDSKPNREYEQGWNAINELIRADSTWSGFERNICYLNNHDGTFTDVSATVGLDFIEDSRTFAFADFDHDGRVEVLLKNRSGPQVRLLKNVAPDMAPAIAFRLQGKKSNRDAIGAAVTVETDSGLQTQYVQAGSGFLAQHSKELFFALGQQKSPVKASIHWPSGLIQNFSDLALNHRIWIEEGSPPARQEPFQTASGARLTEQASANSSTRADQGAQPAETWMLVPIDAPAFSLPDLAGGMQSPATHQGSPILLYFWTAASPLCQQDLEKFQQSRDGSKIYPQVIAINTDDENTSLERYKSLHFPIVRANADTLAIYNILFRSLFDRHRDMDLPCAFLLDANASIVKVYQGRVPQAQLEQDAQSIPQTPAQRMAKALPFSGVVGSYDFGRNYLSYGSLYFERGYPEHAQNFFELVLRDDPSSSEGYYGLASVYLQQQKLDEARKGFERAVQLHPSYPGTLPRAWNNLGIIAARQGRTEDAISHFQKALAIDGNYSVALDNLGNAYRQAKQWNEAKNAFGRALASNPGDPEANYGLGMVYAQLDDVQQAYDYLQKAVAARPVYPEALNNLGVLYIRTHRPQEAEKSFQESIRLAPAFDQSYLNLARLYSLQGESSKARTVLNDLLKEHPGHAQAESLLTQLPK